MHKCKFIANFDTDEMFLPAERSMTVHGLLRKLEEENPSADAYSFERFYVPDNLQSKG